MLSSANRADGANRFTLRFVVTRAEDLAIADVLTQKSDPSASESQPAIS
jgi:hypothetical protein